MAISFIAETDAYGAATSAVTVNKPTGTANGDLMIAMIFNGGTSVIGTITAPWGWIQCTDSPQAQAAASVSGLMYYKIAGYSEPSSYTWNYGIASTYCTVAICTYRGVDINAPFDSHSYFLDTSSTTSHQLSGVTVTNSGCWAVECVTKGGFDSAFTPSTGFTTRGAPWGNWPCAIADTSGTISTGSYTPGNWTSNGSGQAISFLLILKPSGTAPTITFVSYNGSSQARPGVSATINKPTGATTGDLLLALVWTYQLQTITPPSGFSLAPSTPQHENGANTYQTIYYRIVDGTEGSSFVFNFPSSGCYNISMMACYRGVNNTTPFDTQSVNIDSTNVTTHPFSAVTVGGSGRLGLALVTTQGYQGNYTAPVGYNDRYNTFGSDPLALADSSFDLPVGSYTAPSWKDPSAGTAVSYFMVLKPTGTTVTFTRYDRSTFKGIERGVYRGIL
jgi:hypothetical protein